MVKRAFTPEQDKENARLYTEEKWSLRKLAKMHGRDKGAVADSILRTGTKLRRSNREPNAIVGMKSFATKLLTPSEADQLYKVYDVGGFSLSQISIACGFGKNGRALSRAFKERGYKLRGGKILTKRQEKRAIQLYNDGLSTTQTGDKFSVTGDVIINTLKRNGVKRRKHTQPCKYHVNQHAFDHIDNEGSSYWLGFLYADGTVYQENTVIISLTHSDIEHIRKFREFMQSEHRIYRSITNGFGAPRKMTSIRITREHLAKTLIEKGIVKDRIRFQDTLRAIQPGLENHFIRGYLDGDGCIRGAYNPSVTFVGQRDILKWIRATFHRELGTNPNLKIRKGKGIYSINYTGILQARKIVNYLYHDATIWMDRKRQKAESWD